MTEIMVYVLYALSVGFLFKTLPMVAFLVSIVVLGLCTFPVLVRVHRPE